MPELKSLAELTDDGDGWWACGCGPASEETDDEGDWTVSIARAVQGAECLQTLSLGQPSGRRCPMRYWSLASLASSERTGPRARSGEVEVVEFAQMTNFVFNRSSAVGPLKLMAHAWLAFTEAVHTMRLYKPREDVLEEANDIENEK